jgi:hypothetical protein
MWVIMIDHGRPSFGIKTVRAAVLELIDAGVTHIALNLVMPFPHGVAQWVADEVISPVLAEMPAR